MSRFVKFREIDTEKDMAKEFYIDVDRILAFAKHDEKGTVIFFNEFFKVNVENSYEDVKNIILFGVIEDK